jgi:hypothetical protein
VRVPFTWKVIGWFMVGWSPDFPIGEVRRLRHQNSVKDPALSKTDAKGYMAVRKWATQFYELPA